MSFNNTFFKHERDMVEFACNFLEDRGAVLETGGPSHIDALLPESLAKILDVPEYFSITAGSDEDEYPGKISGDNPVFPVNFGSPLLDRVVKKACSEVPVLECTLKFNYLKSKGFDNLISEQFNFFKSTGKVQSTGESRTKYLILTCRYRAQSDEQKEGLVDLIFNVETGAFVPEMPALLTGVEKEFSTNGKLAKFMENQVDEIIGFVKSHALAAVAEKTVSFRESMNRRFVRDAASLDEYYEALRDEMEKSTQRPGLSDRLIKERKEKIAMIPDELTIKKEDLFNKYSIKINICLTAVMAISTPVVKVLFDAAAGNRSRTIPMTYNPVTKSMDPLVCEKCGGSTYRIGFCRDRHLLCAACQSEGCPICRDRLDC